jgi:hypothetical protein
MLKEHPILFSAPMVRALLAGTKTQTRRVVKPRKDRDLGCEIAPSELAGEINGGAYRNAYCAPGDRLWVKETTVKVEDHGWVGPVYAESEQGKFALDWGYGEPDDPDHIPPHDIKLRPSLFMARDMSRITLEVTGVRVERLQDISEADSAAEGVFTWRDGWDRKAAATAFLQGTQARIKTNDGGISQRLYHLLWEQINGLGSWDANPFVWVVNFKRIDSA